MSTSTVAQMTLAHEAATEVMGWTLLEPLSQQDVELARPAPLEARWVDAEGRDKVLVRAWDPEHNIAHAMMLVEKLAPKKPVAHATLSLGLFGEEWHAQFWDVDEGGQGVFADTPELAITRAALAAVRSKQ